MASSGSQQFHRSRGFVPPRQGPAQSEDLGQIGSDKIRLRDEHYELMVSYLEIPKNFQAIIGGDRCTKVGGKYQSKAVVMRQFHAALVHHSFPKDISPANFNKRFQRYVARYKEACEFKSLSGGGLSENELAVGMTLEEKLNKLCSHFERMHGIYGGRPNVRPDLEADFGVNAHDYIFPEESDDTDARCPGESFPAPIESANNQPVLGDTPPARQAPPKKGGKASAASGKEKVPPKDKPMLKEKSDNVLKASFAAIYAEKNAQKADFRLNLIQSRDKWKAEDLEERRQARLEAAKRHWADREEAAERLQADQFTIHRTCIINVCQPGSNLLAVGYCMYSSSVIMVLSVGNGVYGFTLDPLYGEFVLTHRDIKIPNTRKSIPSMKEIISFGMPSLSKYMLYECAPMSAARMQVRPCILTSTQFTI
ncbi:unnamed protein product [Calypogeia fissa]